MSATEFKAKCLQILDQVQLTGEPIRVTKWGKVVAEVIPPRIGHFQFAKAEFGKGEFQVFGDVMETIALKNERESQ